MMKREPGRPLEDAVGGEKGRSDVDRRCCDPEIVNVGRVVERMTGTAASEPQLGSRGEQPIADWHGCRGLDRFLKARVPLLAPSSDQGAIPKLAHGYRSQEKLVFSHLRDLGCEPLAASPAE